MNETPKEAARRLSAPMLDKGFKPTALHTYTDEQGMPIYFRIRAKHPETGEKWIRPMRLNGQGYELAEPKFESGKPLYALQQIASKPDSVVWIVEGEQKADAINKLGLVASTSGSASSAESADWQPLRGRTVRIWPDNDDPGKSYAGEVASALLGMDCAVSCVDVAKLGLGVGEDVIEWLAAHPGASGGDIEALPMLASLTVGGEEARRGNASRITYRRASEIQAKPIHWLWPGRIARGKVSMLAGNPGLGKSQVAASMAATVTTGGLWPVDKTRCDRGSVVILSAEDDAADTIRPRLEAVGADLSRVFILDAVIEGYQADGGVMHRAFNLVEDLARLGDLLSEIGDVALIVIDPITAYLGGADSHKNAEIRALLAPLSDLAALHGAAVVCVSHLNKGGNSDALMRVTGSLAFVAASRAAFVVAKDQDNDARRLLLPLKNNIGNDQTGLAFSIHPAQMQSAAGLIDTSYVAWEPDAVTVTADEAMAQHGDIEERDAVKDAKDFLKGLLADGPVRSKQIKQDAEGAGYSWRTIQRAQKSLGIEAIKEGMSGGWVWQLPYIPITEDRQDTPKTATQNGWHSSHSSVEFGSLLEGRYAEKEAK